eukprot:scaffold32335_cov194-Amphora_coffeaeformis.AAC.1
MPQSEMATHTVAREQGKNTLVGLPIESNSSLPRFSNININWLGKTSKTRRNKTDSMPSLSRFCVSYNHQGEDMVQRGLEPWKRMASTLYQSRTT